MNYPIKSIAIEQDDKLIKSGFKWGDQFNEKNQIPMLAVITGINGSGKSQLLDWIFGNLPSINTRNNAAEILKLNESNVFYKKSGGNAANTINNLPQADVMINQFEDNYRSQVNASSIEQQKRQLWSHQDVKTWFVNHFSDGENQIFYFRRFEKNVIQDQIKNFSVRADYLKFLVEERSKKEFNIIQIINRIGEVIRKNKLDELQRNVGRGRETYQYFYEEINQIISDIKFNDDEENQRFFKHIIKEPINLETGGYQLTFINEDNAEIEIKFDELSSGEKVIFELLCYKYILSNEKYKNHQPKVILLDEFDANLNPALAKIFIDVITDQFVNNGIQVIMTTHSPSTIAYVPEKSLFWMKDGKILWQESERKEKMEIIRELSSGFLSGFEKFRDGYALTYFTDPTKKFYLFVEGWFDILHFKSACRIFNDGQYGHILKQCNLIQMSGVKNPQLIITMIDNFYQRTEICEKIVAIFDNDNNGKKCYDEVHDIKRLKNESVKLLSLPTVDIERMYDESLLKQYFKSCCLTGRLKTDYLGRLIGKEKNGESKAKFARKSSGFKSDDFNKFAPVLKEISDFLPSQQ